VFASIIGYDRYILMFFGNLLRDISVYIPQTIIQVHKNTHGFIRICTKKLRGLRKFRDVGKKNETIVFMLYYSRKFLIDGY